MSVDVIERRVSVRGRLHRTMAHTRTRAGPLATVHVGHEEIPLSEWLLEVAEGQPVVVEITVLRDSNNSGDRAHHEREFSGY